MAESWTCIECESLFDASDGDLDERMCNVCLDDICIAKRFYLKQKGGDPRNYEWHEVSETMYDMATDDEFFKKLIKWTEL